MKGNDLRLRLVVRRHALPEARVVFNVPLDNDPTVARLLEQVNEIIPLESRDWGLEDYVVELHDAEGHAFDCLHFQPVAAVLKNDEEVFIRPLFTEDRKKRLLSGRHQISNDGKHLIDGVPFGRPRHRAPKNRPAVDIPPLKRRRLTYDDSEDLADEDEDEDTQLLLTERGYGDDESLDDVDFDGDAEEDEDDDDEFVADDADDLNEDMDDPADSELEAELQDLEKDNALAAEDDSDDTNFETGLEDHGTENAQAEEDSDESDLDAELEDLEMDNSQAAEEDLEAELWDLETANAQLAEEEQEFRQESQRSGEPVPEPEPTVAPPTMLELLDLDRIAALRAAFPTAPVDVCEKTLIKSNKDESVAYKKLKRRNKPHMPLNDMLAYYDSLHPLHPKPQVEADDELDDGSGAESVDSLVKHYDEHGFPAGSILDGTSSLHMVERLRWAGHMVRLPVHTTFDDGQEDAGVESAQNKGGSAIVCDGPADAGSGSKEPAALDNEPEEEAERTKDTDEDEATSDSGDFSSSESGSNSGSDSDSDSDSGPEEESAKDKTHAQAFGDHSSDSDIDSDSDSDSASDSSDGGAGDDVEITDTNDHEAAASSSETSDGSSSDSSDSESSFLDDSSDSDDPDSSSGTKARPNTSAAGPSTPSAKPSSGTRGQQSKKAQPGSGGPPSASNQTPSTVPPGQGKSATQRRNARRRTAHKIKQAEAKGTSLPHHVPTVGQPQDGTTDQGLADSLAAKKATLLQSLASLSQMASNDDMDLDTEANGVSQSPALAPASEPASTASQRKSKLDVGAGRRMLFGALGLKNPKTKADEDGIRSKLMQDVWPLVNHRLQNSSDVPSQTAPAEEPTAEDEGPDAWREKINYRAVECCEDGVELSEPPFPFVQRWDPQQQYNGGRSKRKQRNQQSFYEDDSQHSAKKRKFAENDSYNDTHDESYFEGDSYWTNGEMTLNYDEPQETHGQSIAEAEQADDHDDGEDLPPLPENLSTLPALQSSEVKQGMVVTWKQLLMSKATNWQPQVSSLTGAVVDVHEDGTFRVLLAKRDRDLDQNAKVYDDEGNRVYDKFEVPDMDEDLEDGAELGYRTVDFLDMVEPRILVQPSKDVATTPPRREETRSTSGDQSTTLDHEQPVEESVVPQSHHEESIIPETNHERTGEVQDAQLSPAVDVSPLTEERRHEISLLINDAGFRKDIDPSIAHKADSVQSLSSPSRQLEQMSHEAAAASDAHSPRLPSMEPTAAAAAAAATSSMYVDSQPILLAPFSGFSDFDNEPVSEARVEYPKLDLPPSDTGSSDYAHTSGRQPDPDFSIDLGNEFSDQLGDDSGLAGAADADDGHDNASAHQHESSDPERTPTKPTLLKPPTHESPAISESSINSFPSLSEVWITASTSNSGSQNSAAVLSAIKARKSDVAPDPEYEEAMRRLDNKHDHDDVENSDDGDDMNLNDKFRLKRESVSQSQDASAAVRKLMDQEIEKPQPKKKTKNSTSPVKTERASVSASSRPTRLSESPRLPRPQKFSPAADRRNSSFVIPKGFQVVSLVTSSPEPEPVEYYPDNDIDESYVATPESSSLPEGDRWVRKIKLRQLRGESLPARAAAAVTSRPAQKKTGSSSQQVKRGVSLGGGGGIVKGGIAKKKTSTRKF
ncbi:hypothetical protein B0T19DRAFT_149644 [Cercophora scortea]|uniref:DUF7357 domain-containing protein n=1 Tax=Cercophora scortea TaxID=314031 RepID=A0AAE0IKS7_9PEZI|nr:hypothetical protein B0T19DRAFT_149644 [Cercophora scortea]